ncbi:MAG: hypothetical protein FWB96_07965 [Defluviitaleaceae bacterium]|nr:hypothetical protein [Defluviitaleaceae bacterium]MCL2262847.1 hypothetical protein [Defluviitaleaceae bacterium]
MNSFEKYIPQVYFELIPICNLVSNQKYQRSLSRRHIERTCANFNLFQINPIKISRRNGQNYVINGQHTIEIIAAVSGSRETPVWCMVYDGLEYLHEADIFAGQQEYTKPLSSFKIFTAHLEADSDTHIIIKTIVEQCGLRLVKSKKNGAICAVTSLVDIYERYGYDGLERTLRLVVQTWEGEASSLTSRMLRGASLMVATFGDSLKDNVFAERVGTISAREIARIARERRAGSIGYAETMLLMYNKKTKSTLSMTRLHAPQKDYAK